MDINVCGLMFAGVRANEVERERSWGLAMELSGGDALTELAARLRRLRVERGLSVEALRVRSGLGRTTVSQALNERAVPSEATVVALAKALRTDAAPLLDLLAAATPDSHMSAGALDQGPRSAGELFTRRYLAFVASRHAQLSVFGLDLSRGDRARWPLDAAYLSLEFAARNEHRGGGDRGDAEGVPSVMVERAERALTGSRRVLVRGQAGGGKTTLLQWLAVSAARGRLPAEMGGWRGAIPFLLPLRTLVRRGSLPAPDGFLRAVDCPLADAQPQGWVDEALAGGRGAVLVDGIDEVPQEQRAAAGRWLEDLVAAYPAAVFVVTTRPSAVPEGWLGALGFAELTVRPMSLTDTGLFVGRWHQAARVGVDDDAERRHLDELEAALRVSVRAQRDLAELATTPLMCAVICALHRDRRGYLPHSRMELYEAALSMLLVRRDRERGVGDPEGVRLSEAQCVLLLQRLAYWLIRNRQSEMDGTTALAVVADALPSMPAVAEQGDAGRVLEHLVGRSGLLRRPSADTIDFIHRTFQDYLGAKAAVEARDFPLLVNNSHDDQWEDVIRMAVAHARPAESADLLRRLVKRGDQRVTYRSRSHLLAAAAVQYTTEVDPQTRALVEARTTALMPPRTHGDAVALAGLGPGVLDLLPATDQSLDPDEARAVIEAVALIGGDQAQVFLQRFAAGSSRRYGFTLGRLWDGFDADEYAREVLSLYPDEDRHVATEGCRRALRLLQPVTRASFRADFTAEEITEYLSIEHTREIRVYDGRALKSLAFLREFTALTHLLLADCAQLRHLDFLAGMGLLDLSLHDLPPAFSFGALASLPALRELSLYTKLPYHDLADVPAPRTLEVLWLGREIGCPITGISRWQQLRQVVVNTALRAHEWRELAELPLLKQLSIESSIEEAVPLPEVTSLDVIHIPESSGTSESFSFEHFPEVFPNLRHLTLLGRPWVPDITPLRGIKELHIDASNLTEVTGGHALDPELISLPRLPRTTA